MTSESIDQIQKQQTQELSAGLANPMTVDRIIEELGKRRFEFTVDDAQLLAQIESMPVDTADDYKLGYEVLDSMAALVKAVEAHYAVWKDPLNRIVGVVRKHEKADVEAVTQHKARLSAALVAWDKADKARRQKEAADEQARLDAIARREHEERLAAMQKIVEQNAATRPDVAQALQQQVESMKTIEPKGRVVTPSVNDAPRVAGFTAETWKAKIVDVRKLLRAWLHNECHIEEACLIDGGLQGFLDKQAAALKKNLPNVYPGVEVECFEEARRTGRRNQWAGR